MVDFEFFLNTYLNIYMVDFELFFEHVFKW
jgi:hypothetical protein